MLKMNRRAITLTGRIPKYDRWNTRRQRHVDEELGKYHQLRTE